MTAARWTRQRQPPTPLRSIHGGLKAPELVRKLGITEQTYYRWPKAYPWENGYVESFNGRLVWASSLEDRELGSGLRHVGG